MSRTRRIALAGALIGFVASAWLWYATERAIASGANAHGLWFSNALGLFFLSLPWSILVWGANLLFVVLTGIDNARANAPFFLAMPVVAGACWGWIGGWLADRAARRRAA